jgi:hypothetical protein
VTTGGVVESYADNAPGTEVPANLTNFLALLRGYRQNGQDIVVDSTNSFEFWYDGYAFTGATHTVTIFVVIKDAIGDTWNTQFNIFVVT